MREASLSGPGSPPHAVEGAANPAKAAPAIEAASAGHRRVRLRVGHKVLLPFLCLSLITGVAASAIVGLQVALTRRAQVDATAIRLEDSVSSSFAIYEQRQLTDVRTLKGTLGVPEALNNGDRARLQQLLFPVVANQLPDPLTALAVNTRGDVTLQVGADVRQPAVCRCSSGGSVSTWPDVARSIANHADKYGPKYVGLESTPAGPVLYTVSPVLLNGASVGGMIVYEPLSALLAETYRGSSLVAAVYTPAGTILAATPDFPRSGANLPASQRDQAVSGSAVVHTSVGGGSGAEEIFYVPWKLRHAVYGYAAVVVPASALFGAQADITQMLASIFVGVALLTFVVAFFVARLITKPLHLLMRATDEVAHGNLGHRAQVTTSDEVGTLTESFNRMTESLERRTDELHRNTEATVLTLADAIDARDPYTHGHSVRVATYSLAIARAFELDESLLPQVEQGCLVHDIGKIGIRDDVLRKPGRLDDGEWEAMREHPTIGYQMLRHLQWSDEVMDIVRYHHERWDGKGYPHGLAGEEIPLLARLVAIADTFDAMTSDRPYRTAFPAEKAVKEIKEGAGTQFDERAVAAFLKARNEVIAALALNRRQPAADGATETGNVPAVRTRRSRSAGPASAPAVAGAAAGGA